MRLRISAGGWVQHCPASLIPNLQTASKLNWCCKWWLWKNSSAVVPDFCRHGSCRASKLLRKASFDPRCWNKPRSRSESKPQPAICFWPDFYISLEDLGRKGTSSTTGVCCSQWFTMWLNYRPDHRQQNWNKDCRHWSADVGHAFDSRDRWSAWRPVLPWTVPFVLLTFRKYKAQFATVLIL